MYVHDYYKFGLCTHKKKTSVCEGNYIVQLVHSCTPADALCTALLRYTYVQCTGTDLGFSVYRWPVLVPNPRVRLSFFFHCTKPTIVLPPWVFGQQFHNVFHFFLVLKIVGDIFFCVLELSIYVFYMTTSSPHRM